MSQKRAPTRSPQLKKSRMPRPSRTSEGGYKLTRLGKYISKNPYPSYKDIIDILTRTDQIDLLAEYGEFNHEQCKLIYENLGNKAIVRKCGELINERGGIEAMRGAYYVIAKHSPLRESDDRRIWAEYWLVSLYWDGVGDWRL